MPRFKTSGTYFARPTRWMTPSLRPPSRYSWTSIETSSPEQSWKAPSASGSPPGADPLFPFVPSAPASASALRRSCTRKRNVRNRWSAIASALHRQRAVRLAEQTEDEEFERLGRRDADQHHQLAAVGESRRIDVRVAAHEERLLLAGAAEGAGPEQAAEEDAELVAQIGAQRRAIGLEHCPLHLPQQGEPQQEHQPAHRELAPGRIARQGARRGQADAVALAEEDVDARRMQLVVARRRNPLVDVEHTGRDDVSRPLRNAEGDLLARQDARRHGGGIDPDQSVPAVVRPGDQQPGVV